MNLHQGMKAVLCKPGTVYFWTTEHKIKKWTWYHHSYKRMSDEYTWLSNSFMYIRVIDNLSYPGRDDVVIVPDTWTQMTDDEAFSYRAELKACHAERQREKQDRLELEWRYGIEAKMKRRMRFKNPIKAIERLDARITNLARYWNAYGCDQYIANMITHFNGLKESLIKYRLDKEELAREAFKPSRVEYSLSCS